MEMGIIWAIYLTGWGEENTQMEARPMVRSSPARAPSSQESWRIGEETT